MPFDNHRNLAVSTVATAPSPATSGLTLTLAAGEGARMPAVPFNATVWPSSTLPTPISAEIVRVTAMSGDQVTAMLRAQEGTVARAIVIGDLFAATVTVKALTDIESGVNFPQLGTVSSLTFAAKSASIGTSTVDGSDDGIMTIAPVGGSAGPTRGPYVQMFGNEYGGANAGALGLVTGVPSGAITLATGSGASHKFHASGGVSLGGQTDPGALNLSVAADLYEKARTVPMGHWQNIPFNAAWFGAVGGGTWTVGAPAITVNRYAIVGRTIIWTIYVSWFSGSNTITGAPSQLQITFPLIFALPQYFTPPYVLDGNGTRITIDGSTSGSSILLTKAAGNWTAGSPGIIFNAVLEST
jgi:hypothetical protein